MAIQYSLPVIIAQVFLTYVSCAECTSVLQNCTHSSAASEAGRLGSDQSQLNGAGSQVSAQNHWRHADAKWCRCRLHREEILWCRLVHYEEHFDFLDRCIGEIAFLFPSMASVNTDLSNVRAEKRFSSLHHRTSARNRSSELAIYYNNLFIWPV